MKKSPVFFTIFLGAFLFATVAFAYTVNFVSYTDSSTMISSSGSGSTNQGWNLGTGLSSPFYSYSLYFLVNKVAGPDEPVYLTITCYNDSAYSSSCGTFVNSASTTPPRNTAGSYTFTIATSTQPIFNPLKYYRITTLGTAGAVYGIKLYGGTATNTCSSNCSGRPYQIATTQFYGPTLTTATATSSSFFSGSLSTTTLANMAGQCSESSNIFSEGLCMAGVFLFIPAPDTLGQFSQLKDTVSTKFPFSYLVSATETWNALTASTTSNAPVYTYALHDLGLGSTTPLGNILPNMTVFGSSTVMTYFPTALFDTLKALAGMALVLGLVADIFFTSRNLLHKV